MFHLVAPLTAGAVALILGFWRNPPALFILGFGMTLLVAVLIAFLHGRQENHGQQARPMRSVLRVAVEGVASLMVLQGTLPLLLGEAPVPSLAANPVVRAPLWQLVFSDPSQAAQKDVPLPEHWETQAVYVRIDLMTPYRGSAGLRVEVNGQPLGTVSNEAGGPWYAVGPSHGWSIRVPRDVLREASQATVTLRPVSVDAQLRIGGHPDAGVDHRLPGNSRFFDGAHWRRDQLAGTTQPPATGTYRVWLVAYLESLS